MTASKAPPLGKTSLIAAASESLRFGVFHAFTTLKLRNCLFYQIALKCRDPPIVSDIVRMGIAQKCIILIVTVSAKTHQSSISNTLQLLEAMIDDTKPVPDAINAVSGQPGVAHKVVS